MRPKSKLPLCVACLFRIGWGIKRIVRHTGVAKTSVHRFRRAQGIDNKSIGEQKRLAFYASKRRVANERQAARREQAALRKAERAALRAVGPHLPWYHKHRERLLPIMRERAKARYQQKRNDPDFVAKRKAATKAWNAANRGYKREYQRTFFKTDTGRALKRGYRRKRRGKPYNRIVENLRRRLREYVRAHGTQTLVLIGCTTAALRAHLEQQFTEGMSWDNYGAWHVDHIKPCSTFDLTDHAQRCACFHFTNLQPLWAADNIAKSNRLDWQAAA